MTLKNDKQCWCDGCTRLAQFDIQWNWKTVKVCKGHKSEDGIHFIWVGGINRVCRCKVKGHK